MILCSIYFRLTLLMTVQGAAGRFGSNICIMCIAHYLYGEADALGHLFNPYSPSRRHHGAFPDMDGICTVTFHEVRIAQIYVGVLLSTFSRWICVFYVILQGG